MGCESILVRLGLTGRHDRLSERVGEIASLVCRDARPAVRGTRLAIPRETSSA